MRGLARAATYILLHLAGFSIVWWFLTRSRGATIVAAVLVPLAVGLVVFVVIPFRRRLSGGDRGPSLIVHIPGGTTSGPLRQSGSRRGVQDDAEHPVADLHLPG